MESVLFNDSVSSSFQFHYEISYPVAMATLAEGPNLEKVMFELVPKV
jgi:hypothetical protein